jgi:ATP-dependent helicase HrpA
LRAAELLEERLRVRDLVQPAEALVEFYATVLPRQVSSAATLEYFTRHLTDAERRALALTPEQIFARRPDDELLAQFPEIVRMNALTIPVEYRFAPGEPGDGATLRIPLLALPTLTRAAVDAAIPGLVGPRIEALLRSLPKDARRGLIPMAATAAGFLSSVGAPCADPARLAQWLMKERGLSAQLVRFDLDQVAAHLRPRLAVGDAGEIASGTDLTELRRRCTPAARAELDAQAQAAYPTPWRRFEEPELAETADLHIAPDPALGTVRVFPTLKRQDGAVVLRFEWSAAEAALALRQGAVHLARIMLNTQARDLAKLIRADAKLLLSAAPYFTADALAELLLQLTFRRACFGEAAAPRTRAAFEAAVDQARAKLHPALAEITATAVGWFTEARAVRRLLEDPRARPHAAAARDTEEHLERLLNAATIDSLSPDWLRQVPRYLKAEERRWQRLFARGAESPHISRELNEWTAQGRALEKQVAAESRRLPELDELRLWIEEYRVSLYAQELKTLGPVSAARLEERAAQIAAWISR